MKAEAGPVHHLGHGPGLLLLGDGGGLPQQEDRLVLQLAGDVDCPGHLPARELEAGEDGGHEPPGVHGEVALRPPGSAGQLVLLTGVVAPHLLDAPGPALLYDGAHAVEHLGAGGDQPQSVQSVEADHKHLLRRGQAEGGQTRLEEKAVSSSSEVDVGHEIEVVSLEQFDDVKQQLSDLNPRGARLSSPGVALQLYPEGGAVPGPL